MVIVRDSLTVPEGLGCTAELRRSELHIVREFFREGTALVDMIGQHTE